MTSTDDDVHVTDDLRYFRERLEDVSLLDRVVMVRDAEGLIGVAVPVGGRRRGGFVNCATAQQAFRVYCTLMSRDGFPALDIKWTADPRTWHAVTWGDPCPAADVPPDVTATWEPSDWEMRDRVLGQYFGYSATAIEEFTLRMRPHYLRRS